VVLGEEGRSVASLRGALSENGALPPLLLLFLLPPLLLLLLLLPLLLAFFNAT
jgi:hypothetical protein